MASRVVHVLAVLHVVSRAPQPLLVHEVLLMASRDHGCVVTVVQLSSSLRTRPWARAEARTMGVPSHVVGALAAHGLEELGHGGVWGEVSKSAHFSKLISGTGTWHVGSSHTWFIKHVINHVVTVVMVHRCTT